MKKKHMHMNMIMLIIVASLCIAKTFAQSGFPERLISLDFNQVKGPFITMFKECVGAGRANEGLRADWQQQLDYVHKECGFKYIRMHGLLTDDMGVYREDSNGNQQYNFQYIDVLYDFIVSIGMKPFVELGFMPEALASGRQTIFWWRGNVTPPKDYDKWEALIRNLTLHFTERYGEDEVKTWYFEVWNEPNLSPAFWTGTQEDYFKLYQYSANAVKSVNKGYRVGGPATAGAAWEVELIDFCGKNSLPLDFISTHSYGVRQGYLDEFGNYGTVLDKNPMSVSGDVLNSRKDIANSSLPNLELHYTEWSSSYTPADPIHDSYHQAAYILDKIKRVGAAATSMSYWVFTDIFEEPGPRFTPFHGGFGLLNYQAINKPAFYSYKFMNQLGHTELMNTDSSSWACKDEKGNIQVLLWDFTYTLPADSINNQDFYIRDLPSQSKGKVKIKISEIPAGTYDVQIYKVGYRVNDPYTTYIDMGKPKQLTHEQVQKIKALHNGSAISSEKIKVKKGAFFVKELDLRENDVFLIAMVKQ
jgi:xylan 1,4-beta-xylosidase